ncbi:TPA: hypothetical protein ACH3X2_011975 [Trebouxia sp. C0005]
MEKAHLHTQVLTTIKRSALLAIWSSAMMALGSSHSCIMKRSDHQADQLGKALVSQLAAAIPFCYNQLQKKF